METLLTYRGRPVTDQDVSFIRELIAAHPGRSRRALSLLLCQEWGWRQANGHPRDMVCRGLLLQLHRAGTIDLPPARHVQPEPGRRLRPAAVEVDRSPLRGSLPALGPLSFRLVRRTGEETLFDGLIEAHHYLGYTAPVGEHLKILVLAGERPVACFIWGSAVRYLAPRDRYLGWPAETRRRNLRFVTYNSRFLIPPWVEVPHLASHLLGWMARRLPSLWLQAYGHPVYFAETFVDPTRYRGTCYRAANWVFLGRTMGRGKNDRTGHATRPIKDVLGYPLHRRFRERLMGDA